MTNIIKFSVHIDVDIDDWQEALAGGTRTADAYENALRDQVYDHVMSAMIDYAEGYVRKSEAEIDAEIVAAKEAVERAEAEVKAAEAEVEQHRQQHYDKLIRELPGNTKSN